MCEDLDNVPVQEYCARPSEDTASGVWDGPSPVPDGSPCRIDAILEHDRTFDRYVLAHRDEVSDHQLSSVLSMLRCENAITKPPDPANLNPHHHQDRDLHD